MTMRLSTVNKYQWEMYSNSSSSTTTMTNERISRQNKPFTVAPLRPKPPINNQTNNNNKKVN